MQSTDQSLSREDYERLLLYLGYARLLLSRPDAKLAPEEAKARQVLAEVHAELERREQKLLERPGPTGCSWGPWN